MPCLSLLGPLLFWEQGRRAGAVLAWGEGALVLQGSCSGACSSSSGMHLEQNVDTGRALAAMGESKQPQAPMQILRGQHGRVPGL